MRRARPLAQSDHLERDGAIKAFLPGAINDSLAAAADLFEQLVIPKIHLDSARLLPTVGVFLERSQSGSEQTNAAKSARPATCASESKATPPGPNTPSFQMIASKSSCLNPPCSSFAIERASVELPIKSIGCGFGG